MVLVFLPPLDFTAVELSGFKKIFFPEHLLIITSNETMNFSAPLNFGKFLALYFVQQLNLYVHTLTHFAP